jgi:hypothetical protein
VRPARILHAPWNVAGNPIGLSRAERELGFRSKLLVIGEHPFGYESDIDLGLAGRMDRRAILKRGLWVLRLLPAYDVFHYNFGESIYQRLDGQGRLHTELSWLKRMGKRILATFQGNDARPPDGNPFVDYSDVQLAEVELLQPQRVATILRHADRVFFLNPDLRHWLPGAEFRPYASIDPFALEATPLPEGTELIIAHAPSDRAQKGTDSVIGAVESLRAEGLKLRLDLIEGVSHNEVIERTRRAHLVIDQVNLGWYGAFAVEAMALGRPVLCYIREEEPADNPWGDELPIVRTTAETLRDDLRALVGDRERIRTAGAEGRSFVEHRHDPRQIARQNLEGLVPFPDTATSPTSAASATTTG